MPEIPAPTMSTSTCRSVGLTYRHVRKVAQQSCFAQCGGLARAKQHSEARHDRRDRQADHQPDLDPQAWRRADRPSNNPPVNALGDGGAAGAGRRDRARPRPTTASRRWSSPARARPSSPAPTSPNSASRRSMPWLPRWSTRSRIAPSRWSRRSTAPRSAAGSRSRSAAIIGSRSRRRSSARPKSSWACFRAPAGRSGCRAWPASSKALEMCATGNPIGAKEAFDCGLVDRLIEGELIPHAVAYAEEVRDVRPLPKIVASAQDKVAERRSGHLRRVPQGQCQASSAASTRPKQHRGGRGRDARSPMPKACIEERKLFMELMTGTQAARAAIFLLRRAQGRQDRRPARGHRAARRSSGSA